jgi:hypothetical protein
MKQEKEVNKDPQITRHLTTDMIEYLEYGASIVGINSKRQRVSLFFVSLVGKNYDGICVNN